MPHDPIKVADTRGWLLKAQLDLSAGEADLQHDPRLCGDAMFHAQQASEKALKAFLSWHELPFRKTHDLRELFAACSSIDPSLSEIAHRAESLTPYAWVLRYPGEHEDPDPLDALEALTQAREVVETVMSRLPDEVRP